jgi:hypothetical protein
VKVVCMPHVRREHVDAFVPALLQAVKEAA